MFGFFDRSNFSWTSLVYRSGNAAIGLYVLNQIFTEHNVDAFEFLPDACLHLAEAMIPGNLNDLMLGLHLGRLMQSSAKVGCSENAQEETIDMFIHSAAVLSRTYGALSDRLSSSPVEAPSPATELSPAH